MIRIVDLRKKWLTNGYCRKSREKKAIVADNKFVWTLLVGLSLFNYFRGVHLRSGSRAIYK